ncbi:MAG: HAD-IIIC family phosphatase [Clostridiales bacterium]|nr:HAD-IIIC family phosphatase [Clostridiales bacterium]
MDCFDYPVDSKLLLRKKIALRKELLAGSEGFPEKRIAVLGGSTTNEIADQLELFLLNDGIKPVLYQSDYAQFWQDAVFGNEELDAFRPDVVFIHTNWRNIPEFPKISSTREEADILLENTFGRFAAMWDALAERYKCPIIQNNIDRPAWRLLGNSDISDHRGKTNFIMRLNQKLYSYADSHKAFYVNDIDYLAASYGLDAWSDPQYWHMYKYSLCLDAIPHLAKSVADIIKSIYGRNKKVIVCDLDNTLWGGVVGDDGVEGIQIGPEVPVGQIYQEFQQYLRELKSIGVLLAVDSKNDSENAIAGLNHPDCVLKPDDFASIKANWENKARNISEIATELNLGMDSFVFLDDNPAEREMIRQTDSAVAVPVMDRVEDYIRAVDGGGYFEVTSLSNDDLARAEMYKANAERVQLEKSSVSYEDYLKSLDMKATIRRFEPIYVQRIAQLTNKSNQFNLTTLRCSESDIENMRISEDFVCLYGKLTDKFGDNGVVSVISGQIENKELHMKLWLMSCRVLKRGMEDAMLDALVSDAKEKDLERVIGYYYPTAKNGMVKDFYQRMGFSLVSSDGMGNSVWRLALDSYEPKRPFIEITR